MANATVSFLGQTNSSGDKNALFLKVFAGEVLAAFQRQNKMLPLTTVRSISSGKSASFPLVGLATSEYHTAGAEITGNAIKHAERVITIDDLLISHAFISNIDEAKKEMAALRKQFADNGWTENGGIDYIYAVISAREGDADGVSNNLKAAISKDENGSFKERIINDLEFVNYQNAVQSAMN